MMFVTVGTHTQGFDRLIEAVDNLIAIGEIKEKIIAQIGYGKYIPKNCKWVRFTSHDNFIKICKKSRVVITHGGVGSIISSLKLKKPTIVVPRLKRFNEHVDDHQLQITEQLEKQRRIIAVYNVSKLKNAINTAKKWRLSKVESKTHILDLIEKFIKDEVMSN